MQLLKNPFRLAPKPMRPFLKAGKVDDIFRPRILRNGVFATPTGYGVSFTLAGVDSEGLDRATLNHLSKQIAVANRVLPAECLVYEFLILTPSAAVPGRPIASPVVNQQAMERAEFLKVTAKFKSVRLIVTLYLPGKVADEAAEFSLKEASLSQLVRDAPTNQKASLRTKINRLRRESKDALIVKLIRMESAAHDHDVREHNLREEILRLTLDAGTRRSK